MNYRVYELNKKTQVIVICFFLTVGSQGIQAQDNSSISSDSFDSSSMPDGSSPSFSMDSLTSDLFGSSNSSTSPSSPNQYYLRIKKEAEAFSKSLPNNPRSLSAIWDALIKKRIDNWNSPKFDLALFNLLNGAIQKKFADVIDPYCVDGDPPVNAWDAWFDAFHASYIYYTYAYPEPERSQAKDAATKALLKAEAVSQLIPQTWPPAAKQTSNTSPKNTPRSVENSYPTGAEIARYAHQLGTQHPNWWRNTGKNEEIRKCNLFVDRIYRDMNIPLPWSNKQIPKSTTCDSN